MHPPLRLSHVLIPVAIAGALSLLAVLGVLRPVSGPVFDTLLRLRRPVAAPTQIILVDLDDEAASLAGSWPWSRSILADGLVTLRELDAHAAVLELGLSRPSAPGLDPVALRQELPDALTREFSRIEENVQSLFDAIRRGSVQPKDASRYVADLVGLVAMARVRLSNAATGIERDEDVLLGQAAGYFGRTFVPIDLSAAEPAPGPALDLSRFQVRTAVAERDPSRRAASITPPVGPVLAGSSGGGFLGVGPGDEPVRRSVPLTARVGDVHYAQIGFAALLDLLGSPELELRPRQIVIHDAAVPGRSGNEDIVIPLGDGGSMFLDWPRGAPGDGFRHLSWARLIQYRDLESRLIAALRDMDAHGYLSYLRSDTPLLGAYENASRLQRDMLAAGTASYVDEWRNARDLFFRLCGQFLEGDAAARIVADAEKAAAYPGLTDDERQGIRTASAAVPRSFTAALGVYRELEQLRSELRDAVVGSLAIITPAGSLDPESTGRTPFGAPASVGAVSAALAATVLDGRFIDPLPAWAGLVVTSVLSLALGLGLYRRGAVELLVAGAGLAIVTAAGIASLFLFGSLLMDPVTPVAGCLATGIALAVNALSAGRARAASLRVAFAGRMRSDGVSRLIASPGLLGKQGRRLEVAVLSVAMEGLAVPEAGPDVEAAARSLRAFHAALGEAVFGENGIVAGASGDSAIACFGVLDDGKERLVQACRAALRVRSLDQGRAGRASSRLAVRVGIDAGACVVGDLGTREPARWSAAGVPTDTAVRLRDLGARYGVGILASGAVTAATADSFVFRMLDRVRVSGHESEIPVSELVGQAGVVDAAAKALVALFAEGRERLDQGDAKGALALFQRILATWPSDGPAALFAERCRQLIDQPGRPPSDPTA